MEINLLLPRSGPDALVPNNDSDRPVSNPIDDFFKSGESSDGELRQYEDIRSAVIKQLQLHSLPDWLQVLFDFCEQDKDDGSKDTAEVVSSVLYKYQRQKPFIITDKMVEEMIDAKTDASESAANSAAFSGDDGEPKQINDTGKPILGMPIRKETLVEFLRRHDKFCHSVAGQDQSLVFDGTRVDASPIGISSTGLGIAGFRPEGHFLGESGYRSKAREYILDELRAHIKVEDTLLGSSLEVALDPICERPEHDWGDDRILSCILRILSVYRHLEQLRRELQRDRKIGNEFVYLKRRRMTSVEVSDSDVTLAPTDSNPEPNFSHGYIVETVTESFDLLTSLCDQLEKFHLRFSSPRTSTSSWLAWGLKFIFPLPIFSIFSIFHLFASLALGWSNSTALQRSNAITELYEGTAPIVSKLLIPGTSVERTEESSSEDFQLSALHNIALTGQSLCLILQAHLQGFDSPFEFELIDRPISRFCLRGIGLPEPRVCAFTQELSCFPDKKVLVFYTGDIETAVPLDLNATPAAIMTLWGPVQALIRNEAPGSVSKPSLLALAALEGLIMPEGTGNQSQSRLWRWREFNEIDHETFAKLKTSGFETTIGLHDMIRLGPYRESAVPLLEHRTSHESIVQFPIRQTELPSLDTSTESDLGRSGRELEFRVSRLDSTSESASDSQGPDSSATFSAQFLHPNGTGKEPVTIRESVVPLSIRQATPPSLDTRTQPGPSRSGKEPELRVSLLGSTSGNSGGSRRSDPPAFSAQLLNPPQACPWEADDEEKRRWGFARESRTSRGNAPGSLGMESFQVAVGISPPFATLQAMFGFRRGPDVTFRQRLLNRPGLLDLDNNCCVFVSLHAGVVRRVRLRDMVAYLVSVNYVDIGTTMYHHRGDLLQALRSDTDMSLWVNELRPHGELVAVIQKCVEHLVSTGIVRKDLQLLWRGRTAGQVKLSHRQQKWIPILTDTRSTTTFAVIVPDCQETPDCTCPMARSTPQNRPDIVWQLPDTYRLHTSVCGYREYLNERDEPITLRKGDKYWINHRRLNLLATALGETTPDKGQPVFYLSVQSSPVSSWFMRYFGKRLVIRESEEGQGADCVVGAGDTFMRQVEAHLG